MTKTFELNFVLAKITQERVWKNIVRKGKQKAGKMDEESFLYYTELVNQLKNKV